MVLLLEDVDTIPERHAFLGNYRRYNVLVIELIVRHKTTDAVRHILGQVSQVLEHLYDGQPAFSPQNYQKHSQPVLIVDAQLTVIESALKGFMKWASGHGSASPEDEQKRASMEDDFQAWCEQLVMYNSEDPHIRRRILAVSTNIATTALIKRPSTMLKVLEQLLMAVPANKPEYKDKLEFKEYLDASTETTYGAMHELQQLAMKVPDNLLEVYDALEGKINEMVASGSVDAKQQLSYQMFLFTIIHRAKGIEPAPRIAKLQAFLQPVKQPWADAQLAASLESFETFCNLIGLSSVRQYLIKHQVHKIEDWATFKLDAEGIALQEGLAERLRNLPLRATKSFLGASTEKIERDTQEHEITCTLWHDAIPAMLPGLLKFLLHAHSFHNPSAWTGLPAEMQPIVSRILTDRFWQSGISGGSKDEFYAKVFGTKNTMEGFGSSIRGTVRNVREACYSILFSLSRLGIHFFGFQELPGPLANALFADAQYLSSHQLISLLGLVRVMIDDCPTEIRPHFLPPLIATCFKEMDSKICASWEALGQRQQVNSDEDALTEEMKQESLLRQFTYTAVMLVAALFDPNRAEAEREKASVGEPPSVSVAGSNASEKGPKYPTLRVFCFTNPTILEPLLVFATHAIRMHDTRSASVVLRVVRNIIPEFSECRALTSEQAAPIREYISSEVLRACVSSLHEPYFVDAHRDLANCIAAILNFYTSLTQTPRTVLVSLPGVKEMDVDNVLAVFARGGLTEKQHRNMVLDMLRSLKGVGVSEWGKLGKSARVIRSERSEMQKKFLQRQEPELGGRRGKGAEVEEGLEGLGALFGDQ
jgi:exportin-5